MRARWPHAVLLVGEIPHDVEADPRQAIHALRDLDVQSSPAVEPTARKYRKVP